MITTKILENNHLEDLIHFEKHIRKTEPDIWVDVMNEDLLKNQFLKRTSTNLIVGLFDDEKMFGRCDLVLHNSLMDFDKTAYIDWIYVEISYRKKGYGKDLIREVIKTSKSLGAKNLYLFTAKNTEAQAFYASVQEFTLENKQVASLDLSS